MIFTVLLPSFSLFLTIGSAKNAVSLILCLILCALRWNFLPCDLFPEPHWYACYLFLSASPDIECLQRTIQRQISESEYIEMKKAQLSSLLQSHGSTHLFDSRRLSARLRFLLKLVRTSPGSGERRSRRDR
jgi:hypothetical protein